MTYLVARLESLHDKGTPFDDYAEAETQAALNSYNESAYGVWEDDGDGELLAIAYMGEVFSK